MVLIPVYVSYSVFNILHSVNLVGHVIVPPYNLQHNVQFPYCINELHNA